MSSADMSFHLSREAPCFAALIASSRASRAAAAARSAFPWIGQVRGSRLIIWHMQIMSDPGTTMMLPCDMAQPFLERGGNHP